MYLCHIVHVQEGEVGLGEGRDDGEDVDLRAAKKSAQWCGDGRAPPALCPPELKVRTPAHTKQLYRVVCLV